MLLNITIFSLVTSNLHSLSPLFVNNRLQIDHAAFSKYFSTIIYNPINLLLENSKFDMAVGSPIITDPLYTNSDSNIQTLINQTYDSSSPTIYSNISYIGIQNCVFSNLYNVENALSINGHYTFYMTNSLFKSCNCHTSVLLLKSQAMSISHVCSYNSNGGQYKFIRSDVPDNSFLQIIFSTIHEDDQIQPANAEYVNSLKNGAIRMQCINVSNIKTNRGIDYFGQPQCLSLLMNTLYKTQSNLACLFNLRNHSYIDRVNYYENTFTDYLMDFDLQDGVKMYFDQCSFSNNRPQNKLWKRTPANSIFFNDCIFTSNDKFPNDFLGRDKVTFTDDVITNLNYQYVTENYCPGTPAVQAYACANGTCPDGKGCPREKFEFNTGEYQYTSVYQPDIETPSPSPVPTESPTHIFTISNEFSNSNIFASSNKFSSTDAFSESELFSSSNAFTTSEIFSKSTEFTKSNSFSASDKFTNSNAFSKSESFSRSKIFSLSKSFTQSTPFSKSQTFVETAEFTKSNDFTRSNAFDMTPTFSPSESFSNSMSFSPSTITEHHNANGGASGLTASQKKIIAIVAGTVGGAGVVGGVVAGIIIGVRHAAVPAIEATALPETGASPVTVETNPVHNMYEENDPFSHDFDINADTEA